MGANGGARRGPAARAATITILAALVLGAAREAGSASLPPEVQGALQRADIPADALSVVLQDAGTGRVLFRWQEEVPRNPASLAKLFTTTAALERLGPSWSWSTPVWLAGPVKDGVLDGSLHLKGSGDPKLVLERLWLLLRRVQQAGVREIRGDIVLDQSAFAVPEVAPGEFDGEPLRPYNVRPAALLLNYRSVLYSFVPDASAGSARVLAEPPLARTAVDRSVPLAAGACGDWRGALKASFSEAATRFAGSYPAGCGELLWPVADPQPASYDARLLEGLWREMGGTLAGRVREGPAPATRPSFEWRSPPLVEVVREINKFSNNVMAEQLFLTLPLEAGAGTAAANAANLAGAPGAANAANAANGAVSALAAPPTPSAPPVTPEAARAWMRAWLAERLGGLQAEVVLDNGSGLSRDSRASARALGQLLVGAFASPSMPELMSSLPISATDGTLRRARVAPGRAHLKTGSLRNVSGVAGYLLPEGGRRLVLVAIVNHPHAGAARPAIDALVQAALAGRLPPPRPPRPGTLP